MARQRSCTTEEVINAAKQLIEQNKPINGPALRRLTKKGRAETLMDIFNTYVEENGPLSLPVVSVVTEQVDQPDLPTELADLKSLMIPEVVDQLDAVFNRANQTANAIHNKRVNAEVMEARAKREEAAREVEEANQDLNNAYNEIEDLNDEVERLGESESQLKAQVAQLNEKLSQAKSQGEQQTLELKDCRQEIEDKAEAIRKLQHNFTVSQEQNGQLTQSLADERETHNLALESDRLAHEKDMQEADTALKTCQEQLQNVQEAHQQVKEDNAGLTAKLEAAYSATEQQKLTHDELLQVKKQQLSQQAEQYQTLQQQYHDTEQALKESQTKYAELDKSLALSQSKAEEVPLLQEKIEQLQAQILQFAAGHADNNKAKKD